MDHLHCAVHDLDRNRHPFHGHRICTRALVERGSKHLEHTQIIAEYVAAVLPAANHNFVSKFTIPVLFVKGHPRIRRAVHFANDHMHFRRFRLAFRRRIGCSRHVIALAVRHVRLHQRSAALYKAVPFHREIHSRQRLVNRRRQFVRRYLCTNDVVAERVVKIKFRHHEIDFFTSADFFATTLRRCGRNFFAAASFFAVGQFADRRRAVVREHDLHRFVFVAFHVFGFQRIELAVRNLHADRHRFALAAVRSSVFARARVVFKSVIDRNAALYRAHILSQNVSAERRGEIGTVRIPIFLRHPFERVDAILIPLVIRAVFVDNKRFVRVRIGQLAHRFGIGHCFVNNVVGNLNSTRCRATHHHFFFCESCRYRHVCRHVIRCVRRRHRRRPLFQGHLFALCVAVVRAALIAATASRQPKRAYYAQSQSQKRCLFEHFHRLYLLFIFIKILFVISIQAGRQRMRRHR